MQSALRDAVRAKKANRSVVLFLWLQQFERIRLAYESVTAHEARVGARFEWLLKVRPDLLFLGELPPLAAMPPQHVFVPRGVMTSDPSLQRLNDHVFLCPRDMCAGRFVHPTAAYRACVGSALATFVPPQRLLQEPYGSHEIILINLSYTIARAGGPDCGRLGRPAASLRTCWPRSPSAWRSARSGAPPRVRSAGAPRRGSSAPGSVSKAGVSESESEIPW